jgi:hypothetical protein
VTVIEINADDPEAAALWRSVGELAEQLPGEWLLIGGLMVQLHALERGITQVRATSDIDILGQARPQWTLTALHETLEKLGFELVGPDLDGYAHRYRNEDDLIVDVLSPEGITPPPKIGGVKAVGAPGGTQALQRAETVTVTVQGTTFELRRPTLLGSILIKARSLMVHSDPPTQREDLLRLLSLLEDPREVAKQLTRNERKWLLRARQRLDMDAPSGLDAEAGRRAVFAYELLIVA